MTFDDPDAVLAVLDDLNRDMEDAEARGDHNAVKAAMERAYERLRIDLGGESPTANLPERVREGVGLIVGAEDRLHRAMMKLGTSDALKREVGADADDDRDYFAPIWFAIDALHKLQHALGLDPAATFQEFLDGDLAAAD